MKILIVFSDFCSNKNTAIRKQIRPSDLQLVSSNNSYFSSAREHDQMQRTSNRCIASTKSPMLVMNFRLVPLMAFILIKVDFSIESHRSLECFISGEGQRPVTRHLGSWILQIYFFIHRNMAHPGAKRIFSYSPTSNKYNFWATSL